MAPRKTSNPKKTAQYYRDNPDARKKKYEYDKKENKSEEDTKYRSELNKERRKRGVYGKGGKDMSHTKDGRIVAEDPSKNRARKGKK